MNRTVPHMTGWLSEPSELRIGDVVMCRHCQCRRRIIDILPLGDLVLGSRNWLGRWFGGVQIGVRPEDVLSSE